MLRRKMANVEAAGLDALSFIEADLDFHLALAEAAENPIILTLIDSIVGLLREQRMRTFEVPGGPSRGQFHHRRIFDAIERRDPGAAREAMRHHLEQVQADSAATVPEPTAATSSD